MPVADSALERSTSSAPARRHYGGAPIQEVVIDLRAALGKDVSTDAFLHVRDGVESQYPEALTMMQLDGGGSFEVEAGPSQVQANSRIIGQEFRSERLREVFRARTDGFSYHKLAPYTTWEDWTPRAYAAWDRYVASVEPSKVTRISVRYVNRIEIPSHAELKDYLLTAPDIAPGLPQLISAYTMQLTMPRPEPGTFVVMRQATVESPQASIITILLDIEVVQSLDMAVTNAAIQAQAEKLHLIEVETFERCITNRTREIIA